MGYTFLVSENLITRAPTYMTCMVEKKPNGTNLLGHLKDIWSHFSYSKLDIGTKCNRKLIFGAGRFVFNHIPESHKDSGNMTQSVQHRGSRNEVITHMQN